MRVPIWEVTTPVKMLIDKLVKTQSKGKKEMGGALTYQEVEGWGGLCCPHLGICTLCAQPLTQQMVDDETVLQESGFRR